MNKIHPLMFWLLLVLSPWALGQGIDIPQASRPGAEDDLNKVAQAAFEDQLGATRAALKITPTQAAYWQVFEDKVRALMADMTRSQPAVPESQTAPQKIERSVDTVRDRLTAMEEISAAAQALYAQLDARQKSIADLRLPITVPPLYSGLGPSVRPPMMDGMHRRPQSAPPQ